MSDRMSVLPFETLLGWILSEYEANASIFGIHRSLFYTPRADSRYATHMFGCRLATPIGPAAGPHTQLAQNIVCAWLSGGRFIELKTVQVMDQLEIPRPCIDAADEGYNVEWSQELRLEASANEYVKAWALIHVLRRLLGFEETTPFGTIFNMSVGYDLSGIQSAPMAHFMDQLQDASTTLAEIGSILEVRFPRFSGIAIPASLTNNVTLSTMHGCPPGEIERIARHLLEERGLHTTVKLNPTLLGKEAVNRILHDDLGYADIQIPDAVFEHDLSYERAVQLLRILQEVAAQRGLTFGVKLSNTLAMANARGVLPGEEVYMSGRALYPVTMNLFRKLAHEFSEDASQGCAPGLNVSYSAGADAFNVTQILAAGARPVTVATDLLKPGGYSRLLQYLEELQQEMEVRGAGSLEELEQDKMRHLDQAAAEALVHQRYKRSYHPYGLPKVASGLDLFDCIAAPCVEQCAVRQDVPGYAWCIARGEIDHALGVILAQNPLPGVTGYVCTHLCQTRCTRNNYDEPVAIRALKRFAADRGREVETAFLQRAPFSGIRVAVVGSGPSGLGAAFFLALNGVEVTVFEAKDVAGGMLAIAPAFRLPPEVVKRDIDRIERVGVEIRLSHRIAEPPETLLNSGFDAVYLACGFARDARLDIEGIEGAGVSSALELLERVSRGKRPVLGRKVLVIGGGNTAMDAARTSQRLTGEPATVVYRRTRAEMPADAEEIEGLLAEGNVLEELVTPKRVVLEDGRVRALVCLRNRLGEVGPDGRRTPLPVEGSAFEIQADAILVAVGQRPEIAFLDGSGVSVAKQGGIEVNRESGLAGVSCVYAGGDVVRGPAIIVEACADGRRAAEAICRKFGLPFDRPAARPLALSEQDILEVKRARARRAPQRRPAMLPVERRDSFQVVEQTLAEDAAYEEAARCMQCADLCDKCVEVCPNRANYAYQVPPVSLELPLLTCEGRQLIVAGWEGFRVEQTRQIVHVDDFCNECGNCATFCVHQGKPYLDKPRLFLRQEDFEREDDNAFLVQGQTIRRRAGGQESWLWLEGGNLAFENAQVRVDLSDVFQMQDGTVKAHFEGLMSLRQAAEMATVLRGLRTSLPFLLG